MKYAFAIFLLSLTMPAAAQFRQDQPGHYFCSAPAGKFFRQEVGQIIPGQSVRFGVRLLKDNYHPDYAPAASIILVIPDGDLKITVGEAQNDRQHLFVALQRPASKSQEALFQFPLNDLWITVELSLDKRGRLTIGSDRLTEHVSIGTTQIAKTTLHCNSGEFEIVLSPEAAGEAAPTSST